MVELYIGKLLRNSIKIDILTTVNIILCDNMVQVPADFLSVVDTILSQ